MAIIKPTKPDSELPKTWGGTQYPYTEEQIEDGLPEAIPTIIDGGTLNYEKKGIFERVEYVTKVSDAVAGTPIKKTLITNANNQFEYAGIGVYSYSATQVYALDDFVITSTNEGTKIYKSLSNNNIGKELTNETYWEELSLGGGSGLEIGDIGFAPLGIDEAQNKRRYLNGQVISQSQFATFTDKVKKAIALYPSLSATETNWQAEKTNSKLGQCGKFVVDDTAGTIRLPKVVNVQGLQDLALMGSIKAESLPNITGEVFPYQNDGILKPTNICKGAFYQGTQKGNTYVGQGGAGYGLGFDASHSSSTYQDNAPVQQEAIQYPYFIQVATGVEESVDVTREIELNNPFSLLDYKWSEYEITNASWLLSNGAFHSGATYPAVYELLLKIHNGTETKDGVSVKLSTEAYTDTDFVINTADTTFRLPVKVKLASGNAVVGNGMTLGVVRGATSTAGTDIYGKEVYASNQTQNEGMAYWSSSPSNPVGVTKDPLKSGLVLADNDMYLYFYVGETIQDANVIAASQVLTAVADCVRKSSATDRATVVGWGLPDYSAGIQISSFPYTVTFKGWLIGQTSQTTENFIYVNDLVVAHAYNNYSQVQVPVDVGDVVTKTGSAFLHIFPMKGAN